MKITVAGTGYVGLSLATLLSQKYNVIAYDISEEKVELINKRVSPIKDKEIEEFFSSKDLKLSATTDYKEAFASSDYVIISTPTNYDESEGYFDTTSVEDVLLKIQSLNIKPTIIIKSTIPVGFTEEMRKKFKGLSIFFSPEFLREGRALYDNLYPSRIIIGSDTKEAKKFAKMLKECALSDNIDVLFMGSSEAEAVKLFANTYLALRIAFFNELDTYAEVKHLDTKSIIQGVCLDKRIGDNYNNPSFGYGGYCLPKDTKQLLANYKSIPQNIIEAIVLSNNTRKKHIGDVILKKKPKTVGIYRLIMKKDSDNFRSSAIFDIIDMLKENNIEIVIYEPTIDVDEINKCKVENDLEKFDEIVDIILANRIDDVVSRLNTKVYTRDIFLRD